MAGVVLAWRSTRRRDGNRSAERRLAGAAVGAGAIASIGGVINLLIADGGPGTGNGVVGGAAAVVTGLLAIAVGIRQFGAPTT